MAQRGLWSEALFRFRQAERNDPANAHIQNNIAVAYEALGLFDEALESYKSALRLNSTSAELKRNYSRFAEFYQAFQPEQKEGESEEESGSPLPEDDVETKPDGDANTQ